MVVEELQRTRRKVLSSAVVPLDSAPESQAGLPAYRQRELYSGAINNGQSERVDVLPLAGPEQTTAVATPSSDDSAPALERVDQAKKNAEASVILSALNQTRWNRRQAADLLQIDYKALLYKMKKLQISA